MTLTKSEAKYVLGALLLAERQGWQNVAGDGIRAKLAGHVFGANGALIDDYDAEGCMNEGANEILGR